MRAFDETASECIELEQQSRFNFSRKSVAVGVCAVLAVTAIGASKWSQQSGVSLTEDAVIELAEECADEFSNCLETKCCKKKGYKCYLKNEYWANCNDTCAVDHVDSYDAEHNITAGWNCSEIKAPEKCDTPNDVSCFDSGCCKDPDHFCYIKNQWWANCNPECKPGPQAYEHSHYAGDEWKCQIHGMPCDKEVEDAEGQMKCCIDHACKGDEDDKDCIEKRCGFYQEQIDKPTTTAAATTAAAPAPA